MIARLRHIESPALLRGFTLIEVLLATFVLALGVLGLAALFAGGARQQQLATETTRATSLAEAAVAWQSNFGVMSSLDENGDGRSDFEQVVDVGRWYALATQINTNIDVQRGRVALVTGLGTGGVLQYPSASGAALTRFQPFFRKVNDKPVVLYQRPAHWSPRMNDQGSFAPIAEASATAAAGNYDPRTPGSPFAIPPYGLHDSKPTTRVSDRVRGPAFLPDRAILPETVEMTVSYFEHDQRYVFGQVEQIEAFDPFTLPDGQGQALPGLNVAAAPRGRVFVDPDLSKFRWVNPRSRLFAQPSPIIPLNQRIPGNTLPFEVLTPSDVNGQSTGLSFPSESVWNANGESNLDYYGVFMPKGGRYPSDFQLNPLPADVQEFNRPSYLVMFLAPDLTNDDLEDPNPTIVGFDLSGVLTDNLRARQAGIDTGTEAGPRRSVEQIRVDRYVSRLERMPAPSDRVITVPDETREDGTRPVLGYSSLYRRTPDGNGELAIFGYRISPVSRRGSFVPHEDPVEYEQNRNSPIVSSSFDVFWDANRQQYYTVLVNGIAESVIRPGALILFAGPPPAGGTTTLSVEALGADAAVRIVTRVRVGGQLRGYLDAPPRFRGRPLGDLGENPPQTERLLGWHVRDRVRSQLPVDGVPPGGNQPLYQLESLEVRVVPVRER